MARGSSNIRRQLTQPMLVFPLPAPAVLVKSGQNDANGSTSCVVPWPSATVAGNFLIAFVNTFVASPTITPPAGDGWALLTTQAGSQGGSTWRIYYRANAPSQSGSKTWGISASDFWAVIVAEFSALNTVATIDVRAETGTASTSVADQMTISALGPTTARDIAFLCIETSNASTRITALSAPGWTYVNGTGTNVADTIVVGYQGSVPAGAALPSETANWTASSASSGSPAEAFQFTLQLAAAPWQIVVPSSDVTPIGWTPSSGTTLSPMVSDQADSTFITSTI